MTSLSDLPKRELERLSAYLDGQLSSRETSQLEARLRADPGLRQALDDLRGTVQMLRGLPEVKAPRSFALTPEMVGPVRHPSLPWLQWATAAATLAFVVVVSWDALGSLGLAGAPMAAREVGLLAQEALPTTEGELLAEAPAELAPQAADSAAEPEEAFEAALPEVEDTDAQKAPAEEGATADEARAQGTPVGMSVAPETEAPEATATPTLAPTSTPVPTPEPSPTPAAAFFAERTRPRPLPFLRITEILLGALSLSLLGLTLWVRRRR